MRVDRLNSTEWQKLSESAHFGMFSEMRPSSLERIHFALLALDEKKTVVSYATFKELDSESIHLEYGGIAPNERGKGLGKKVLRHFLKELRESYKRIGFRVDNKNVAMQKLALSMGFRTIGVRTFKSRIYLEYHLEFGKE